jgi:hypothetical protein
VTNYRCEIVTDRHPPAIEERTFRRRRLGLLAAVLGLVLAAAPLLEAVRADDGAVVEVAAAEPARQDEVIRAAAIGSPTAVRELLSETTTTLVEATGATTTTSTTALPTTTTTTTTTAAPTTSTTVAPASTSSSTSSTSTSASSTATSSAPAPTTTTTAPPRTTTTTTAPPRTTTTTTAPPRSDASTGYAYDDPRSTQVWHDLARCESGGNWSINTGNGYYGGLQFALATWESVGGTGYPHEHPAATQIDFGRKLQARQGWGAWPHCSEKLGLR